MKFAFAFGFFVWLDLLRVGGGCFVVGREDRIDDTKKFAKIIITEILNR